MAQLELIRASAGSGKTFSLTRFFLEMVLNESSPEYFKRILAVTFTNKATAEMKERIIKELSILAFGEKSEHLEHLLKVTKKKEARIRNLSEHILNNILHGYSWFRVETIDSFFQGIIRSFIRELNIPGNYNIELDQDKILEEAINRLLDKLDSKNKLVEWLLQYIDSRISEGKSWVIKNELQKLGKSLFNEGLIEKLPQIEPLINESNFLNAYYDALIAIAKSHENKIISLARKVLDKINSLGLEDSDFFYKGAGTTGYFKNIINKQLELPGKRIETLLENPDKWASKNCTRKLEVEQLGSTLFNPTIVKIKKIITEESPEYNTAVAILKNLHILGLLSNLHQELQSLKREKGIMLISDSSPFIRNIINHNDTPFIYEKTGNHFNHILIDEFQDTSSMQWENFKPLISNSLAKDKDCLLVGDIKQSIYRWRNSNWEILASQVKNELTKEMVADTHLSTNWRSSAEIIRFNNIFFRKCSEICQGMVNEEQVNSLPVDEIYADVNQEIPSFRAKDEGYINFKLFDRKEVKEDPEYFGPELVDRINEVLANGYQPGDIAILVRHRTEGVELAEYLVNANKDKKFIHSVGVISNESLFLNISPSVRLLLAAMKFVFSPEDRLVAAEVANAFKQVFALEPDGSVLLTPGYFEVESLSQLICDDFIENCKALRMDNLYSVAEQLTAILNLQALKTEDVYLHSFLDIVFNYSTTELADLSTFLEFWEEEGHKKTISAAETPDSIRILTIHKSKGLEFPVVFVPFCNWSASPKTGEQLWLTTEEEPFRKLPLIPVNYGNSLANSLFEGDYQTENYKTVIDNINLLYVAFTRAGNALIVFIQNNDNPKDTGDITIKTLENVFSSNLSGNLKYESSEMRYTAGTLPRKTTETNNLNVKIFSSECISNAKFPEVKISSEAQKFMQKAEPEEKRKVDAPLGRILHAAMEKIVHPKDIRKSVQQIVLQGILSEEDGLQIKSRLEESLKKPMVRSWFSEKNTILTEADIIGISGKANRPDRVVISGEQVSIIDYKFGGDEEHQKHIRQVKKYMLLVKEMGYKNIRGYVWYIFEDKITEV